MNAQELVSIAKSKGRDLPWWQAHDFLRCKDILTVIPNHAVAQRVVAEVMDFLDNGTPIGIDIFLLPECPHDCAECRAYNAEANKRSREHFKSVGLL